MIRLISLTLGTAVVLLAASPSPASAQSLSQVQLDTRYDRALAAGYKALFLCGALGGDTTGIRRTEQSVEEYELAGIQAPLNEIVPTLSHRIERVADGALDYVAVDWTDDMPPRIAAYRQTGGCALLPIGASVPDGETVRSLPIDPVGDPDAYPLRAAPSVRVDQVARSAVETATYGEGSRTTAVMVRQNDRTRGEAYAAGFDADLSQRTWSVAKSLAATVIGAAVLRGEADVTASAGLGEEASDPRRAITIDHLLRMASGRYTDTPGNRTDPLYYGGATVAEVALDWPLLHAPGSTYRYANNDTLAAVHAIETTFAAHPPSVLFETLGMHATVAETDWQGGYILSSQVWTSAADLARFGQLYLDDGMRHGTRILPEGWLDYVSAPSGPQPEGPFGYGAGFWLMNDSDGVPKDTIAAFGNRGQYVVIVPSRNTVIVRRGEDPTGTRFDIAAFTRDVLAALD